MNREDYTELYLYAFSVGNYPKTLHYYVWFNRSRESKGMRNEDEWASENCFHLWFERRWKVNEARGIEWRHQMAKTTEE